MCSVPQGLSFLLGADAQPLSPSVFRTTLLVTLASTDAEQLVPRDIVEPDERVLARLALLAPRGACPGDAHADVVAALALLSERVARVAGDFSLFLEPRAWAWQWFKWACSRGVLRVEYMSPRQHARELALFDVFDCARRIGCLPQLVARLRETAVPMPDPLRECLRYAFAQQRAPRIFGHRFDPCEHPENTAEAFEYAARTLRVDGMEVDVCLTRDGHLVCTHDRLPPALTAHGNDGFYTWLRVRGYETLFYADKAFLATTVVLDHGHKPTEQMSLTELRDSRKLVHLGSRAHLHHEIPTLDSIAAAMAHMVAQGVRAQPELWVDLKVPNDETVLAVVAQQLGAIVQRHSLDASRLIVGNGDGPTLATLKRLLRAHFPTLPFRFSLDDAMIGPWDKADAHTRAADNCAASDCNLVMDIGRVLFGPDAAFLEAAGAAARVVADNQARHANALELCLWTLNDELVMRKCMGLLDGDTAFHFIITDTIDRMRRAIAKAQD